MKLESTYYVEVSEELVRIVEIRAGSFDEAMKKAKKMYSGGEIVLDADDFAGVDFEVKEFYENDGGKEDV